MTLGTGHELTGMVAGHTIVFDIRVLFVLLMAHVAFIDFKMLRIFRYIVGIDHLTLDVR